MSLKIDRPDTGRAEARSPVKIDYEVCDRTGVCAAVCPEDVFVHKDGYTHIADGMACTECWICVENCASQAIAIG